MQNGNNFQWFPALFGINFHFRVLDFHEVLERTLHKPGWTLSFRDRPYHKGRANARRTLNPALPLVFLCKCIRWFVNLLLHRSIQLRKRGRNVAAAAQTGGNLIGEPGPVVNLRQLQMVGGENDIRSENVNNIFLNPMYLIHNYSYRESPLVSPKGFP